MALNNVTVINNSTSSGAAVDLTPITTLLNQILALLNTILGLLPIGRSFDSSGQEFWPLGKYQLGLEHASAGHLLLTGSVSKPVWLGEC